MRAKRSSNDRVRQLGVQELVALIGELKVLKGFYIDKLYEERDNVFRLSLSRAGAKKEVRCVLPYALNETQYIEKAGEPTSFAMAARKRIMGYQIDAVEQYHSDRIIILKLRKGSDAANIVVEMFGKGNFIITDSAMKILLACKPHRFQDRAVVPGVVYEPPKNTGQVTPKAAPKMELGSLQKALDQQYKAELPAPAAKDKELEGIRVSIERQKAILDKIEQEIMDSKLVGDAIFKQLNVINALIDTAKASKHVTKEQLQQLAKDIKVLEVDLKSKEIAVEL